MLAGACGAARAGGSSCRDEVGIPSSSAWEARYRVMFPRGEEVDSLIEEEKRAVGERFGAGGEAAPGELP